MQVFNKEIISLFPTPVFTMNYVCSNDIRNSLKNEEMNDEATVDRYGLFSKDTYILNKPEYTDLANVIKQNALEMLTEILSLKVSEVKISQSWISHKSPGEAHEPHTHGNSYISGVYYFEDDDNEIEPITFQKNGITGNQNVMIIPINSENAHNKPFAWDHFKYSPAPNTLIFFPSWLPHSVKTNAFSKTRKSLAFNVVPKSLGSAILLNELIL
jgi:uncharacterized protein (TIGR02466 family)